MEPGGTETPGEASPGLEFFNPIGFAYFVKSASLGTRFYQTLLDRSWRRSGTLLYRPNQRASCCPHYTIRLDSSEFKPSRDQRQTVNRFNKYVTGDDYVKEAARLHPKSREEAKERHNEFRFPDRVHEAEHGRLKTPPEPVHKLTITLEPDTFTEEKYHVYDNYQNVVHKDPPSQRSRQSFRRFLCSSPLRRETMTAADGRKRRLGSFHQCYRIDGDLVAIGVLDLLPDCVSSVYFLYHESLHKYSPGKLGAIHEIALAADDGYRWWYPGFYIHSCPKMKYKIDYAPQQILDPEALSWDPLDKDVLRLLDRKKYVSLSAERQNPSKQEDEVEVDRVTENPGSTDKKMRDEGDEGKDEVDEDEEEEDNGGWLFSTTTPGIPLISELEQVDLDQLALNVFPEGPLLVTSNLRAWATDSIYAWPGLKAAVAEMVAALGVDCVDVLCVDLAPPSK